MANLWDDPSSERPGPTDTIRTAKKRVRELEAELKNIKETITEINRAIRTQISEGVSAYEFSSEAGGTRKFTKVSIKDMRELREQYQDEARLIESKIRALDPDRKNTDFITVTF